MSTAPGSPYQPPQSDMNPAPKSRSRGVLMGLGIGCGLLLLLCCGGVGGTFWFIKSKTSDDPNVVRKVAAEIADVPLPADFKPRYSIDLPFGFQGAKMKGVVYEGKADSVFMMGEYNAEMTETERDRVVQKMLQNFRMQGGGANDKLDILESKSIELTMRGKPAKFKFAKAQNVDTKAKFWQIVGTFIGREGPAVVLLILPLEKFSEAQLKEMFEKTT